MSHNTDEYIKTESMYDRSTESLRHKESYDVRTPLEEAVYEMEMSHAEFDNKPWDTLF